MSTRNFDFLKKEKTKDFLLKNEWLSSISKVSFQFKSLTINFCNALSPLNLCLFPSKFLFPQLFVTARGSSLPLFKTFCNQLFHVTFETYLKVQKSGAE